MPINQHTLLSILQGALQRIKDRQMDFMCIAIRDAAMLLPEPAITPHMRFEYYKAATNLILPWKPLGVAEDEAWFDTSTEAQELRVAILSQAVRELSLRLKLEEQLAA